ncbi:hypothetical protein EON65_21520 [archaeon]|nr:MAG: hypothetical protein EON65_21520 [archaeon]
MEMVAHLTRDIEREVREMFTPVMVYSNSEANEAARMRFRAQEVDEAAFFQYAYWTARLWREVKGLQADGTITKFQGET